MNAFLVLVALVLFILYLVYLLSKRKFNYWKKKNVPYVEPVPFLGNYGRYMLGLDYPGQVIQRLCHRFPDQPYFGAFYGTEPVLVVQSPEILRLVFTKDFPYFNGREISNYTHNEVTTQNLFFNSGDEWKVVRQNLTPLFSSAKMKNMFYLIEKCSHVFEDMLQKETKICDVHDARDLSIRFTMDCICTCAFGVEANTMSEDTKNPFRQMGIAIFGTTVVTGLKIICRAVWPKIFYGLGFKVFPPVIGAFFSQMLKGVFQSRDYKPSKRNDFVDLVLSLKQQDYLTGDSLSTATTGEIRRIQLKVDDELLLAQCIVFFAAGFDTSASTISFTLFELAKNPEAQKKAAEEVDRYMLKNCNKLSYECVNELPYIEACVYETLRKYPVLGNLTREVMEDYVFPSGLKVDKGVRVHIPVYTIHHNPDYFPEPEKYIPERFLPENKDNIKPYTFFPFGEGPRLCIGKRFARMQVIAGIVTFLKTYSMELADGMPDTVTFDARSWLTQPKDMGLMLKMTKREGWDLRNYVRA